MLSIIIPSYKDPLLHKTIESLLTNAEGDIEIIPVIDGYELQEPILQDYRIKPLILKNNVGMRNAINYGVVASHGEFIMRVDEHCDFGKYYDRILTETIESNWIVTPRRYRLDINTWETLGRKIDYEKLVILKSRNKFASRAWRKRDRERKKYLIDETMAMQGSCWIMRRSHWDKVIGKLQTEGYGTHYQDSIEMVFKTWKAGGKLMVNKMTWFAHKHRKFKRTHDYKKALYIKSFEHALNVWGDYYHKIIKPAWGLT